MTSFIVLGSVLLTATLSGIFGMGGGMLLMGVLAVALPLSSAMLLHGSTQLAANAYRAFLLREHIQWRIVWRLGAGALFALATLTYLQAELGLDAIFIVLGGLPLVVLSLPDRFRLSIESRAQAFSCGFLFSALQILAGASGPILDAFFLRGGLSRFSIVATKSTISSLGHVLKLLYWGVFLRSAEALSVPIWLFVAAAFVAFAGTRVGKRILGLLGEKQFHRYSRWLIVAIAVVYLWRGLS